MKLGFGIGVALMLAAPAAAAPRADDPAALVRRLYVNEAAAGQGEPLWWSYLTGQSRELFLRQQRIGAKTGSAIIDFDFLCQCQDPVGMRITSLSIVNRTATRATAHVRFTYGGNTEVGSLQIELVKANGWRIADMKDRKGMTFTGLIRTELKQYPDR